MGEQRYLPFGSERLTPDIGETDFGFTGQRDLAAVGLMDYNARFYDARLGRFTQADTIVPQMFRPQSLNRFAYVENNPLNFIDPSGHGLCSSIDGSCNYTTSPSPTTSSGTTSTTTTTTTATKQGGYQEVEKKSTASITEDLSIGGDENSVSPGSPLKQNFRPDAINGCEFFGFPATCGLTYGQRAATIPFVVSAFLVVDVILVKATVNLSAAIALDPEPLSKAGLLIFHIGVLWADVAVGYLHVSYAHWVVTGEWIDSWDDLSNWRTAP